MDGLAKMCGLLQDDLSYEIFWARLRYDIECSIDSALRLFELTGMISKEEADFQKTWKDTFKNLEHEGKKIVLYGCGVGRAIAELILKENINFFGFCDRNSEAYVSGVLGKPVLPPNYILEHADEFYIVITTMDYYLEIYRFLKQNQFPEEHILPYFSKRGVSFSNLINRQYFDFPELYSSNTAFVDAGCFDCQSSIRFAQWCNGNYSKIIAFEPDYDNYRRCTEIKRLNSIERMELIHAGLSNTSGIARFSANANSSSYFIETDRLDSSMKGIGHACGKIEEIHTIALDDMSVETKIGFIKMDIEGEEYRALQGAKDTLLRDKPLLAISVYHRRGDILAIMDYLHNLIPEYRFWIRHYSPIGLETVLYAAI